jgi:cysteine-rich repeat protein
VVRGFAIAWIACVVAAGCIRDNLVECGFGLCPTDTVCDEIHATCVTSAQVDACAGIADRTPCSANGTPGLCDQGFCIPGCGDGVRGSDEACDDGNFAANDGCTATCTVEEATWTPWTNGWSPRANHTAAYDSTRGVFVLVGGRNAASYAQTVWERASALAPSEESWTQQPTPIFADFASLAYDSNRQRLVLYGFINSLEPKTYEYDGTTWSEQTLSIQPSTRLGASMVYDATRQRVVLFGGYKSANGELFNDTWEYDGTAWTQLTPTTSPPPRWYATMTYDSTRGVVVMHGGAAAFLYSDTWELANGEWTQRVAHSATSPLRRYGATLAFLPSKNRSVLVGGQLPSGYFATDTWEYTAGTWTQVTTSVVPPGRVFTSMTLDAQRNVLVLVGGITDTLNGGVLDDVWEYGQTGWVRVTPRFAPPAMIGPAAALDTKRGELVMFGGSATNVGALAETWIFNGTWNARAPSTSPPARYGAAMTYDAARDRVVMFGGHPGALADVWEWDGTNWMPGPAGPPGCGRASLVFDPERRVNVLFGGVVAADVGVGNTWELANGTWTQTIASGAPVGNGAYDSRRHGVVAVTLAGETWLYRDGAWSSLGGGAPRRHQAMFATDPQRGRVVMAGGVDAVSLEYSSEIWELGDDDQWRRLSVEGAIPGRHFGTVASRPGAPGLALFGGSGSTLYLNDTWLFQYR